MANPGTGSRGGWADRPRPRIGPHYFRAHGHGNDYLVLEEGEGPLLTVAAVQRICDRHRGPGGDGVVVVESERGDSAPAPGDAGEEGLVRLRMFNPDGGEFERSGNGLRIAAAWLRRQNRVGSDPFQALVGGERVRMRISAPDRAGIFDAAVEMGRATVPAAAPFVAPDALTADGRVALELIAADSRVRTLHALPVAVGNPHAVIFGARWTHAEVVHFGPQVAVHPAFPQGTNVQFVQEPRGRRIELRIWERGVGHTLSSGTSASAAVVAAVRAGLLAPGRAIVSMEGGAMEVTVEADWRVELRGPVQEICTGTLAPGLLAGEGDVGGEP